MHAFWTSSLQLAIFVRRSQGGGGYRPGVVFKSSSPPTLMQPTDTTPRIAVSRRLLVCLPGACSLAGAIPGEGCSSPTPLGALYGSLDRDRARTVQRRGRCGSAGSSHPTYPRRLSLRRRNARNVSAILGPGRCPVSTVKCFLACQCRLQLGCCLASFVLHVTGSRGCSPKAAASAFGLLSARIPPPGRSNSVERPPLPKPPGLPGVDLLLGDPRPRRARRRVCAPLHADFFTLSPQSVFPMRWPAVVVGSRDRRGQAGFAPHFSGRLGGLLGCTSRPGRSSTACTPLIKQVLVPW